MEHSGRNRHGQKGLDYSAIGYERIYRPAVGANPPEKRRGADAFSNWLLIQTVAAAVVFAVMTAIRLISVPLYTDIEAGVTGSPLGNAEIGTLAQQAVDYIRESETFAELFGTGTASESAAQPVFTPQAKSGAPGEAEVFRKIQEGSGSAVKTDTPHSRPLLPGEFCLPALYTEITSHFGEREDPFTGETVFHSGLDLAMDEGTVVRAALAGKVRLTGEDEVGGMYVIVSHADGFESYYGHLSRIDTAEGQPVAAGEPIAVSGDTGITTGAHLHFELTKDGECIDPEPYLDV